MLKDFISHKNGIANGKGHKLTIDGNGDFGVGGGNGCFHGIVCWLRDQSSLVFKINRCRDFLHAADEGFVGFLDAVRRNIHRTGSLVGVIPLADVCVLIHGEDILG